jgi:hypothetical protein
MAGRGRGNRGRGRGNNRGCGRGNSGRNNQNRGNNTSNSNNAPRQGGRNTKPVCQICKKEGHEAPRCWYRYDDDDDDQQNQKTAGAATIGYGYDSNWYVDSGASDHVTSELEKLTIRDKYTG